MDPHQFPNHIDSECVVAGPSRGLRDEQQRSIGGAEVLPAPNTGERLDSSPVLASSHLVLHVEVELPVQCGRDRLVEKPIDELGVRTQVGRSLGHRKTHPTHREVWRGPENRDGLPHRLALSKHDLVPVFGQFFVEPVSTRMPATATPNAKPPTWAEYATPPPFCSPSIETKSTRKYMSRANVGIDESIGPVLRSGRRGRASNLWLRPAVKACTLRRPTPPDAPL